MKPDVSFIEIGSATADRTRSFLEQLFDWDFHPMGDAGQGWFETPTMKAGLHGNDPSPSILVFFSVPSLEEAIAKVRALGGEATDPTEEPGFGSFSMCRDPQGLPFGLHRR